MKPFAEMKKLLLATAIALLPLAARAAPPPTPSPAEKAEAEACMTKAKNAQTCRELIDIGTGEIDFLKRLAVKHNLSPPPAGETTHMMLADDFAGWNRHAGIKTMLDWSPCNGDAAAPRFSTAERVAYVHANLGTFNKDDLPVITDTAAQHELRFDHDYKGQWFRDTVAFEGSEAARWGGAGYTIAFDTAVCPDVTDETLLTKATAMNDGQQVRVTGRIDTVSRSGRVVLRGCHFG
jgi:hypothetical protein